MVEHEGNPSVYEGQKIEESKKILDYLCWCVESLKSGPPQKSHDGPCGFGDCDAGCADVYHYNQTIYEIEKFLNN